MIPPADLSVSVASWRRLSPWLLLAILAASVYVAGLTVPYRVDTDTGFQLRSVQQWLHGESTTPATLRLPQVEDLSRDELLWSNWWPPGFPLVYSPLAGLLPLAFALRLTSLILFLVGSAGWLLLMEQFAPPLWIRNLFAVSLAGYAVTLGGAASLRTADILVYATGPWLLLLALRIGDSETTTLKLFLTSAALGASFWVRYSLFLTALPLLVWVALRLLQRDGPFSPRKIGRIAVLALGFALPVGILFLINLQQAPTLLEGASGTRSAWVIDDVESARSLRLAVSLVGVPGLGFFQSDMWITHLAYFSDNHLPALRGASNVDRLLLKSILGVPGTLVLFWGLWRQCRRRLGNLSLLVSFALTVLFVELTVVSLMVGYNYLGNEPRLVVGLMPAASLAALAGWASEDGRLARIATVVLIAVFVVAPFSFVAANYFKNEIGDRLVLQSQRSPSGLFQPDISLRSVPQVQAAISAVLHSPEDVLVLAGPPGWGSSFVMWLEFPQRVLPAGTFVAPLGVRYTGALDLHGPGRLMTSRRLRVVLVVAKSLIARGWFPRLLSRFPQARSWQAAPMPWHSEVAVYFSDLSVPKD